MKTLSTQTRNESYEKVQRAHKTQLDKDKIKKALQSGPKSDAQLVAITGLPVNILTGRRNELVGAGELESAGKVWNPDTKRNVTLWRTTEGQKPVFQMPEPILNASQWQIAI